VKTNLEKLKYLLNLEATSNNDLSVDEEKELDWLLAIREEEKRKSEPLPKCCNEIVTNPLARLTLKDSGNSETSGAYWHILYESFNNAHFSVQVNYCPFCSTKLPKVQRKSPVPEGICISRNDDEYCYSCGRTRFCLCNPAVAAFECI
jgi:hypothetical protein